MKLTEYEQNTLDDIEKAIFEGKLSNNFMVQNFELLNKYLNFTSISDYAREIKISYNAVKKNKSLEKVNIGKQKFIINNK